jgi:predicted DNA-binding WGR domain protein
LQTDLKDRSDKASGRWRNITVLILNGMITQPCHLYVERTDETKNMARYYAMEISTTLFGGICLTRQWGRIGRSGQRRVHHFDREVDAFGLLLDLMRRKRA